MKYLLLQLLKADVKYVVLHLLVQKDFVWITIISVVLGQRHAANAHGVFCVRLAIAC
jgi:hypothetical protein